MENKFEMPTLTTVVFDNEDVITSSFPLGDDSFPGYNPYAE